VPVSRRRPTDPPPSSVRDAAKTTGWALALWGGVQAAAMVLERKPLALGMVQAAMAEWGAGRLGITWSDPWAPLPSGAEVARRAARGAALGAAVSGGVVVAALVTGGATAVRGSPNVGLLMVGLTSAVLTAVRDELLLRGVVLRVTRGLFPTWAAVMTCGAAAAAARFGVDGSVSAAVPADALRAVALAALWLRDRGAWMACAANASSIWALGSIVRGGLVDIRFPGEPEAGASAVAVLAAVAAVAAVSLRRLQPAL
jgi:hypothetical protein